MACERASLLRADCNEARAWCWWPGSRKGAAGASFLFWRFALGRLLGNIAVCPVYGMGTVACSFFLSSCVGWHGYLGPEYALVGVASTTQGFRDGLVLSISSLFLYARHVLRTAHPLRFCHHVCRGVVRKIDRAKAGQLRASSCAPPRCATVLKQHPILLGAIVRLSVRLVHTVQFQRVGPHNDLSWLAQTVLAHRSEEERIGERVL